MAKFTPPMYSTVRKRVTQQRAVVVRHKSEEERQKESAKAEKAAAEARAKDDKLRAAAKKKETDAAAKSVAKAVPPAKKAAKKVAKKAPAAKKTAKKVAKPKFPKWSPDDNRDKLYKLGKKLDLSVNSRDTKDWIIKQLKKAEKKASK